jgi:hypothetical protein
MNFRIETIIGVYDTLKRHVLNSSKKNVSFERRKYLNQKI